MAGGENAPSLAGVVFIGRALESLHRHGHVTYGQVGLPGTQV